jgi:hypothetical protein
MTAPGHLIVNLVVLSRKEDPGLALPVVIGAVLPDLPQLVFYAWAKLSLGLPEMVIWSDAYFRPGWQIVFSSFHSFVIAGIGLVVALALRRRWPAALCASVLLHGLGDFVLHHDDAHMQLFPLTSWRFVSPVSYWDPAHFGVLIALAETLVVLAGAIYLIATTTSRVTRAAASVAVALLAIGWAFAVVMWM